MKPWLALSWCVLLALGLGGHAVAKTGKVRLLHLRRATGGDAVDPPRAVARRARPRAGIAPGAIPIIVGSVPTPVMDRPEDAAGLSANAASAIRTPPPAGGSATGPVTAGVVTAAPARAPSASLPAVGAGAFRYTRNGIAFITTTPPPAGATDVLPYILVGNCHACDTLPDAGFGRLALNTTAYATEIATAAQTWGVDEWLVRAIIHAESGFNPNAVSNKGAQGLMQLMPGTATRFGVRDALVAADNIRGGVQYLALLTQRYHGDIRLIAAAYDAGEENVDRYGGVPPFAETLRYVDRVVALAARYRGVN